MAFIDRASQHPGQVLVRRPHSFKRNSAEERANALVRKSLGALYRQFGEAWWRAQGASKFDEKLGTAFTGSLAGDALDYEVVKKTPDAFEVNVTDVVTPGSTRNWGARTWFLLVCGGDFSFAEGFAVRAAHPNADDHAGRRPCDFRYKLKQGEGRRGAVVAAALAPYGSCLHPTSDSRDRVLRKYQHGGAYADCMSRKVAGSVSRRRLSRPLYDRSVQARARKLKWLAAKPSTDIERSTCNGRHDPFAAWRVRAEVPISFSSPTHGPYRSWLMLRRSMATPPVRERACTSVQRWFPR